MILVSEDQSALRALTVGFFRVLFVFSLFVLSKMGQAQIVINEFVASNTSDFVDPDYNETGDWIELYNAGLSAVDVSGYTLTDNFNDTEKWKIPGGTQIASKGFLLFWADDHNTGSHTSFKLSADGEELALINPSGALVDSVSFGLQHINVSMGRNPNELTQWVFFSEPTPGKPNSSTWFDGIVRNSPDFTVEGGIFNKTISLNLRTLYNGTVRYTLNGSEPDETSPIANSPIPITDNTVVRARIFKTGLLPGPVVTHSYFIDLNNELTDLPVISISSAPENFWDPVKGIYVVHDTKPDWEIPINIELFEYEERDKAAFNVQAGAKSTGLYSWQLPEKMLGISFRKEYGTGKLEYPLIFNKPRKTYDTFSLRASGSDWGNTLFRDGMTQSATIGYTDIDISGFRPCVVYINGAYTGIYNIREKIDEDYVIGNHGLEEGTFDMVEETDAGHYAETGDLVANAQFLTLIAKDLSNQSNYNAVAAEMDLAEFTDMVCTEVYSGNSSIGHNLMKWKPKDSGKWRWILMDLDRGFFSVNSHLISFYISEDNWPFGNLMKNPDYKKQFGRKLADHLFTTFNQERIISLIEKHKQAIEAEMPNHIKRWKGTSGTGNYSNIKAIPSLDYWLSEVEALKTFAQSRPAVILNDLAKYGFQSPVPVSIITSPAKAGVLTFNGMKIPVDVCTGGYPKGERIKLAAEASAGYKFMGWKANIDSSLIGREQVWKYSDTGMNLGTTWKNPDFNDSAWDSGQAELGYGDNDEKTVIRFGNNSSDKFITSYFRKNFVIGDKDKVINLTLLLKCDDGAVMYLNGNEIRRYNMPAGVISFATTANSSISGSDESDFHPFIIDAEFLVNGNNVIAVEVHQNSAVSNSDMSFDLELSAQTVGSGSYLSTSNELEVTPQSAFRVSAVFESDGRCILPAEITSEWILTKDCSPYVSSGDVTISAAGKLNIESGVEIWMSDGASIYSAGTINAIGTKAEPVIFRGNPERGTKEWGFISLSDVSDTSRFTNVIIKDASRGERPGEAGAISAYKSAVHFDNIHFDSISANPIATRLCNVSLTNSLLHSAITGDLINVTRGMGTIENCEFIGNTMPDNDAIDFNGGANSIVRNCIIRDFFGINSDAIDLGEKASNIHIDGLYVHDITDKGVSVGQQSSAYISNSLFTNCNLGAGVKDSSYAEIDHCTFYGVGTPVATYEKNTGRAGGNLKVTNSILSNAYEASYLCDQYSTIDISFSASDNNRLPDGKHNLFVNPQFNNPTIFDFSLKSNSSCIAAGSNGNMGSGLTDTGIEPEVLISDIAYFTESTAEKLEFIGIYNPGNSRVDISGYQFISGISYTFPEGVSIAPNEKIYVTSNAASSFWDGKGASLYQWESGKLADEGEDIQLVNEVTTMIDEVAYGTKSPWPVITNSNQAITLTRFDVDNHFGENWVLIDFDDVVGRKNPVKKDVALKVFPNPTSGIVCISGAEMKNQNAEIYNLNGLKVQTDKLNGINPTIDLSRLHQGVYLLKMNTLTQRIVLLK